MKHKLIKTKKILTKPITNSENEKNEKKLTIFFENQNQKNPKSKKRLRFFLPFFQTHAYLHKLVGHLVGHFA